MYKMLVTDADGTLLDSHGKIPEEVKEALLKLRDNGLIITIATGRMQKRTEPIARELKVNAPIICYNGALIVDMYTGKRLLEMPIPSQKLSSLFVILKRWGYEPVIYHEETFMVEELNERTQWYIGFGPKVDYHVVSDLPEFIKNKNISSFKVLALDDLQDPKPIDPELLQILEKEYDVSYSLKGYLEITLKEVNKGNALKILSEELKIDSKNILAVGDSGNDISMLKYAGMGIAMGTADEKTRAYADYVTSSDSRGGFLDIINKFFKKP